MTRLAVTAKEFNQKPSSYLPELGTYEAYCFDEACAHLLIELREQARKEAKEEIENERNGMHKQKTNNNFVSLDWLANKQEQLKKTGRYK